MAQAYLKGGKAVRATEVATMCEKRTVRVRQPLKTTWVRFVCAALESGMKPEFACDTADELVEALELFKRDVGCPHVDEPIAKARRTVVELG